MSRGPRRLLEDADRPNLGLVVGLSSLGPGQTADPHTSKRIFQNRSGLAGLNLQTLDRLGVAKRRAIPRTERPARSPAVITEWLTPPEVAALLRIRLEKILGWVRDGRLLAVNVASDGSTRPRWRISQAALEAFLNARSNRAAAAAPPTRRRRRTQSDDIVEFFT